MQYMLDTDICIYLIKHKSADLLARFSSLTPGDVVISAITLGELQFGVAKSLQQARNQAALEHLQDFLPVLEFDVPAATEYGRVRAELELAGQPIGSFDTLIAAHARSLGLVLVTNIEKHFCRVNGLAIENWARA